MKSKLSMLSRVLLVVAAIGLIFVLYLPIWRIELDAPQYPEGLALKIHANGLKGNVDIINGLNHYIGMKTLHNEDFIEFTILPYAIIFFSVLFALAAILNRRRWLNLAFILFVAFGIIAMVDFWRWEYNYGHNLDPNAAIVVPGMAYQPPLIGFKQLLNFGAYSMPDVGGWIFVAVGAVLLFCFIMEWRRSIKIRKGIVMLLVSPLFLSACNTGPQTINPGVDNCYFCKMTISDIRFAAEIVTKKGKVYKFDDMHCLLTFLRSDMIGKEQVGDVYVTSYSGGHPLINVKDALLLKANDLRSPMGGNIAAFDNRDSMAFVMKKYPGNTYTWNELSKQ